MTVGFEDLNDHDDSPDDKNGKRDEKDHAKPIYRPMERFYEHVDEKRDDE